MHRFALALGLILLLRWNSPEAANPPAAAQFWPLPGVAPVLSPSGRWVAWIAGDQTDATLWVASSSNPGSGRRVPIPPGRGWARDLVWTGSGELVVLSRGDRAGGFWLLPTPEGALQPLTPPEGDTWVRLLHPQPAAVSRVCVEGFAGSNHAGGRRGRGLDLLTVDVATGRVVRFARNPGDVVEWFADDSGTARLALAIRGNRQELRVRSNGVADGRWRPVESFDGVRDAVTVAGLSPDGFRAWISARLGRDTLGVYELDVAAGCFSRVLAVDDSFDIVGGLQLVGGLPSCLSWDRTLPHTEWFDGAWTSTVGSLAEGNPGVVWKPVSVCRDGTRAVFSKLSDRVPAEFMVVDRGDPAGIRPLPSSARLSVTGVARIPVTWTARDGQTLSGYLTGPDASQRMPTVVLVHGGPWTRDNWGWDPEAQFLASHGWRVLQINYRGSSGFGRRFQEAGAGDWAGVSTRDLLDGVRWAVDRGWADPSNVVVIGGSFGGYLAYAAMTDGANPFRAGVTLEGVFDLPPWLDIRASTEPAFVLATQRWRLLGASRPDSQWTFRRLPHLRHPLLVIQALDDDLVPAGLARRLLTLAGPLQVPMEARWIPDGGHHLGGIRGTPEIWDGAASFLLK